MIVGMSQSVDLQVLARYLDRIATDDERAAVQTWMQGDPARRALLAELEAAWRADADRLGTPPDADAVWARLSRQLGFSDAGIMRPPAPRVLRLVLARTPAPRVVNAVKWAAAIAGVTVAGIGVWQVIRGRTTEASAVAYQMR